MQDWFVHAIVLGTAAWLLLRALVRPAPATKCSRCRSCSDAPTASTVEFRVSARTDANISAELPPASRP